MLMGAVALWATAACVTPGTDVVRPSIATPPAAVAASQPPRERTPRPLPEPDMRSRFAPPLDVEISISRNGVLEAITAPGASCSATVAFVPAADVPDGLRPVRIADRSGRVAWTYGAVPGAPSGIQTVNCSRGGQLVTATARLAGQ